MDRRTLLKGTAVATALTLAGCTENGETADPDGNGEEETENGAAEDPVDEDRDEDDEELATLSEAYWEAFEDGDSDQYSQLFHSESSYGNQETWDKDDYWVSEELTVTVEDREIAYHTDTTATITEQVRWETPEEGETDLESVLEVEIEDGEWKIVAPSQARPAQ
ncbi:DUF4440 domain-containing protein [Natronobacterium gregoryi]|uniref:Protein exported by TAT pathway n=2 Tax=Natronobacterium gregoryi TaxID=44930 RepID=L0AFL1_NATGS|nr:DUF4440 domain-containing protein [Natronobacterium gregoryi]AFZ71937.1 protein exported by TAT pathway [Natronobacterium gregoryi SP2]ELY62567.1 hypothetical protein C490_17806 [Natronobacterium gregoryi SP2]PLK20716.1 hypothetical protein CYV19_08160 [Natronobacterium gregoryi SP2]SFJ13361.1 TAT (twin-arginine translocation) pathway signal sequence [Natronobacterium gregoryi]